MKFCPFSLFLFTVTAAAHTALLVRKQKERKTQLEETEQTSTPQQMFQVVFVLGGPGAGKGTQCELLSTNLKWAHLSAGDLLRAERNNPKSEVGELVNNLIKEGKIVPASITVGLLRTAMENIQKSTGQTKFLIDGFPRSEDNVSVWKEQMSDVSTMEFVLFLDCPEDVMTSRLLERGKTSGRNDDNLATIRKRFDTFREQNMPIVDMYEKEGMVRKVTADRSVEDVYKEVSALFEGL